MNDHCRLGLHFFYVASTILNKYNIKNSYSLPFVDCPKKLATSQNVGLTFSYQGKQVTQSDQI